MTREDLQQIAALMDAKFDEKLAPVFDRLDSMDKRMDSMEKRMDSMEKRMDAMQEEIEIIREDCAITREAVNTIGTWTERFAAENKIPYPIMKKAQ